MTEDDRLIRYEISTFFESLKWAKTCGLEFEFMEFFLRDYGINKDVIEAVNYANAEWDL